MFNDKIKVPSCLCRLIISVTKSNKCGHPVTLFRLVVQSGGWEISSAGVMACGPTGGPVLVGT
jgi:hypothetical protein